VAGTACSYKHGLGSRQAPARCGVCPSAGFSGRDGGGEWYADSCLGAIDRPLNCHSIRKSLLSGLFGISVDAGRIALPSTLADLGIDDCAPALTAQERQATVEQLLMSR
jgi:hypothetical protein